MCAPDRKKFAPLVTLATVAPALMLAVDHQITGSVFGLSADFWKGAVIGVTLGLQILAFTLLIRLRRGGGNGPMKP